MRIHGKFTLDELAERMNRNRPDQLLLEGGWAGVHDAQSNLGVLNAAPPISDVEIHSETPITSVDQNEDTAYIPERLLGRFYFFVERKGLREARPDASDHELHEVAAIDVAISKISENESLLLVSTRNLSDARKYPLKKLLLMLQSIDGNARIETENSPIALPSPDLYLWLMVKARDTQSIDSRTEIRSIEAVHGQDSAYRVTVLNDVVSFDRPGFLIAVAEGDELGPAKVTLYDSVDNVKICFTLWQSGMFSVITGSTYYPDEVDNATWRLRAVFDLAYHLIPRMIEAHRVDQNWNKVVRPKEIREAAEALVKRYSITDDVEA